MTDAPATVAQKVLVVRGRTNSTVYHSTAHCPKLREHARRVNRKAAEASGKTLCGWCKEHAGTTHICTESETTCPLGKRADTRPTTGRPRLYEQRQAHITAEAYA
jgi:hypothetical protein